MARFFACFQILLPVKCTELTNWFCDSVFEGRPNPRNKRYDRMVQVDSGSGQVCPYRRYLPEWFDANHLVYISSRLGPIAWQCRRFFHWVCEVIKSARDGLIRHQIHWGGEYKFWRLSGPNHRRFFRGSNRLCSLPKELDQGILISPSFLIIWSDWTVRL